LDDGGASLRQSLSGGGTPREMIAAGASEAFRGRVVHGGRDHAHRFGYARREVATVELQ